MKILSGIKPVLGTGKIGDHCLIAHVQVVATTENDMGGLEMQ